MNKIFHFIAFTILFPTISLAQAVKDIDSVPIKQLNKKNVRFFDYNMLNLEKMPNKNEEPLVDDSPGGVFVIPRPEKLEKEESVRQIYLEAKKTVQT